MRAKIKSVRKINEIFLSIFTYIWKLNIFSTCLILDKKCFSVYFKSQISKWPEQSESHKIFSNTRNEQILLTPSNKHTLQFSSLHSNFRTRLPGHGGYCWGAQRKTFSGGTVSWVQAIQYKPDKSAKTLGKYCIVQLELSWTL